MAWTPPTQAEVEGYFDKLNNWCRWGEADQVGTLNLITPEKRQAALKLAQRGRPVSLARDIVPNPNLDYQLLYPDHRTGCDVSWDYFDMVFHGTTFTHIDALCHISYEGKLYNDHTFDASLTSGGADWGSIDPWFEGITTRGVLLDVASARPEGYVTVGNPTTPADLDAAAERAGGRGGAGAAWCPIDPLFGGLTTRGVLLDVAAGRKEGYVTVGKPVTPPELDAAAARAGIAVEPGDVVWTDRGGAQWTGAVCAGQSGLGATHITPSRFTYVLH